MQSDAAKKKETPALGAHLDDDTWLEKLSKSTDVDQVLACANIEQVDLTSDCSNLQ